MVAMRGRLQAALRHGTTLCEVKTGYGALPEAELRLLRLIGEAAAGQAVAVSPTFLCHIPPKELGGPEMLERQQFVAALALAVTQAAAAGAQAVDVYCDAGAFTRAETELLLRTGQAAGLLLRCHAEQFTHTGAAALAAQLGAASVEHLEQMDEAGAFHAGAGRHGGKPAAGGGADAAAAVAGRAATGGGGGAGGAGDGQ